MSCTLTAPLWLKSALQQGVAAPTALQATPAPANRVFAPEQPPAATTEQVDPAQHAPVAGVELSSTRIAGVAPFADEFHAPLVEVNENPVAPVELGIHTAIPDDGTALIQYNVEAVSAAGAANVA
jgi:hypothetical protein